MNERFKDQDIREWAALYALDALPADERAAFEQYLKEAAQEVLAEVNALLGVAGQLGFGPFPASPPPAMRARLLERIGGLGAAEGEPSSTEAGDPVLFNEGGLLISRSMVVPWIPGNVAGVQVKPLFVDAARNYTTALVRMEPGTVYPSHRHNDVEELFLLEGDLLVEGLRMGPGDYCRAEPNSLHGQVSTASGALFLVLASNANEIVA